MPELPQVVHGDQLLKLVQFPLKGGTVGRGELSQTLEDAPQNLVLLVEPRRKALDLLVLGVELVLETVGQTGKLNDARLAARELQLQAIALVQLLYQQLKQVATLELLQLLARTL